MLFFIPLNHGKDLVHAQILQKEHLSYIGQYDDFFFSPPGFVNHYLAFEAEMLNKIDIQSFTEAKNIFDFWFSNITFAISL